ncbi:aldose 1-epimerase family protein [Propionispora vibrioides]|uniref:Galactose mutarotase n=1 Tax=Propionispora vibrioides TaxID=112903 RepID=A0A1H8URP4_9FIRM|nr:aldose 1-epimerase family protein [Propionispora vibrioides]SEP05859.1 protein of unknown function [Propionispora vibrioides]
MPVIHGIHYSKAKLLERCGNISQVAGYKRYVISEGRGKGVEAVEIYNGNGLQFTVLLDKTLDIADCSYQGVNLAYMTGNGIVAPQFYDSHGNGWLRSFNGGLLSTCGITYCGAASEDEGELLGLHGRISHCPADNICCEAVWEKEDYVITVRGRSYETRLHGEFLELRREIKIRAGDNTIYLHDEIENQGYRPVPLMMIYHCNFGFPLYDAGSEIYIDSVECAPNDEVSSKSLDDRNLVPEPRPLVPESVYFHRMNVSRGYGLAALINRKIGRKGLGVFLKYDLKELPYLNQWKMIAAGHYVLGLEPSNCRTLGRASEKAEGRLRYIEPGETRHFNLAIIISEEIDNQIGQ